MIVIVKVGTEIKRYEFIIAEAARQFIVNLPSGWELISVA